MKYAWVFPQAAAQARPPSIYFLSSIAGTFILFLSREDHVFAGRDSNGMAESLRPNAPSVPIVGDGNTHAVSDLSGIGLGFHDTTMWLVTLTSHWLPGSFYAGNALGSFSSLLRLLTGLLAGPRMVWSIFPQILKDT